MSGSAWLALLLAWALQAGTGTAPPAPPATRDLERGLGLLQYVASDYEAAVDSAGRVRSRDEHAEQLRLLDDVEAALRPALAGRALQAELQRLQRDVAAHRPPAEVVPRLRRLHDRLVQVFGIHLAPRVMPSLAAGRRLYEQSCAECHGADGRAATPRARTLQPPPADLLAPALAATLSPYQAFTVVSFGVPGTAMASFEALEESERWSLAFWVLALRHRDVPRSAEPPILYLGLEELARATDADLARRLQHLPAPRRAGEIARLRSALPLPPGD
jgi:high-affinity iron transporter